MKIVLTSHHFPPRYASGVELYTYRLAQWLLDHGHDVWVVCVESITNRGHELRCIKDAYDGIPVFRLHFDLHAAPDPFHWRFWNPKIGAWFRQFIGRVQPDVVHINSLYLLSASVAAVAKDMGFPVVMTLHDYWFPCPRITLLKPDGSVCSAENDTVECAWCLMMQRRRYRIPEMASHQMAGRLATWALRRPRVARFLGWQKGVDALRERQNVLRNVLERVDTIIVATRFLRDMIVKAGCPPHKILVSPYGLNLSGWKPFATPNDDPQHLHIAYIGQITYIKGIHVLIRAFNRLKGSERTPELKIYGNLERFPDYAARLRKLTDDNPRIIFAGRYDNRDTPRIFAGIDVLVIPSIWYEGSPLIILEALATKTPVVASNMGGMAELIQQNINGLLFDPGDVRELEEVLQHLLDDPAVLFELRQGIEPIRTIDDEMAELMEVYRSLVSEGADYPGDMTDHQVPFHPVGGGAT